MLDALRQPLLVASCTLLLQLCLIALTSFSSAFPPPKRHHMFSLACIVFSSRFLAEKTQPFVNWAQTKHSTLSNGTWSPYLCSCVSLLSQSLPLCSPSFSSVPHFSTALVFSLDLLRFSFKPSLLLAAPQYCIPVTAFFTLPRMFLFIMFAMLQSLTLTINPYFKFSSFECSPLSP